MGEIIRAASHRALQRAAPEPHRLNARKRQRFLDTLAATCNVCMAAKAAGAATTTFYRLRRRDEAFSDAWQAAMAIGYHRLEEALLDYALSRVEADAVDPERADPAATEDGIARKLARREVSEQDLRLGLQLLSRHRATVEGRGVNKRGIRRATAEETDAALRRQLDILARQMKKHGA